MAEFGPVPLPPELRPVRLQAEAYANAKVQRFAHAFARRVNPALTKEQVDYVASGILGEMAAMQEPMPLMPQQNLRLVLRHDCLSSGCGDTGCVLCQYNPSRICKRNLKAKYLIDDHLRAKCGAGLRVEVVDEQGACVADPLPDMELEVHVLNGEKYKEVCPDNTLLNSMQLRGCIIQPATKKPLLKRESALGSVSDEQRIFLPVENGQAPLSDLQCTTSSEALLLGKAPTFRLLVWAIDRHGSPLQHVTYVVSESFVVATKRVKHAIKSDIPSIGDHVSKLVHIGKATVDKLTDVRQAAAEENLDVDVPEHLNKVEKVGQFRELVEMTEQSSDLKHKLRSLLKLSPEKWEEVTQHALLAVVPDFRPRVWWYPGIQGGLLFPARNGAIQSEQPVAFVHREAPGSPESVTPIQQVDGLLYSLLPKLKQQAMQDWYAPGHTGWQVYWNDPADVLAQQLQPTANGPSFVPLPLGVAAAAALSTTGGDPMVAAAAAAAAAAGLPLGAVMQPSPQLMVMGNGLQQLSPQQLMAQQQQQQQQQQQLQQQQLQQQQLQQQQLLQQQQQQQYAQQYVQPGTPAQQQYMQQLPLPPQMQQQARQSSMGGGQMPPPSAPSEAALASVAAAAAAAAASAAAASGFAMPAVPPVSVPAPGQQRHSVPGYSTARSPFATQHLQSTLSAQFPKWQGGPSPAATPTSQQGQSAGGSQAGGQSHGGAANGNVSSAGGARQSQMGQQQQQEAMQHTQMQAQQQLQAQQQQQQQQYQMAPGSTGGAAGQQPPGSSAGGGDPSAGGAADAAAAAAAEGVPASAAPGLQPAPPSLEMLNTDDLPPIRDTSWSLGTLGTLGTLDSLAQMQMLAELPSVGVGSMLGELGCGPAGAGGGGGQHLAGGGAAAGHGAAPGAADAAGGEGDDGQPERALSLKFSMSLDLEEYNKSGQS